ncbi:hypothetical protein EW146_g6262 [Bondarzewia mesenterica]|uniref:lactoylglutathione lyase n=1 Tax=Bondarzewia mesenterica TaxID=1095465 RepID=A0A4S4LP42_9AGAM|nr:hypothetical protein EW146_g6262 [Bondarzewia mesenterica]
MIRIKDPKVSIPFYTDVLGMDFVSSHDFSDFTLYFLAYDDSDGKLTGGEKEARRLSREGTYLYPPFMRFSRKPLFDAGILELTHNHGTEALAETPYVSGNVDPKGFGHIAITVPDVEAACARFQKLGVAFQKKLTDGNMKNIAFILDPDGYWIEVLQH